MKIRNRLLLACASAAVLSACGSSSTDNRLALRVIHASPDAPEVNVLIDGAAVLSAVDYKEGSGFLELQRGTYDIEVEAITPAGNVVVIDLPGTELARRTDYSVLAIGEVAGGTLEPLIPANDTTQVSAGQARAQVVHGAPSAPPVVVYVTAPGASLAGVAPLGSFSFGEDLGPVEVPGGNYQIRVAPAAAPGTVVFDSGTVSLSAGVDLLIVAVDNTTTGHEPDLPGGHPLSQPCAG